ncbi:uncharacterized protein LOC134270457, partial [Saccostrea cucullata]|uniref:uncharacterized protein LOC134270457 n=1 Tax=Saccostrea cuccullata TaxID=36930 RepID=UPI002ED1BF48
MASYSWIDLDIQHLSESVFVGLCHKVGTSQQVTMRRELLDMDEMVKNQVIFTSEKTITIISGSFKEGFRLMESDIDLMTWRKDHNIIWDLDQAQNYDLSIKTLILSVCSESPPGFALLELLTETGNESTENACIRINDRLYISSSEFRRIKNSAYIPDSMEHGPWDE